MNTKFYNMFVTHKTDTTFWYIKALCYDLYKGKKMAKFAEKKYFWNLDNSVIVCLMKLITCTYPCVNSGAGVMLSRAAGTAQECFLDAALNVMLCRHCTCPHFVNTTLLTFIFLSLAALTVVAAFLKVSTGAMHFGKIHCVPSVQRTRVI